MSTTASILIVDDETHVGAALRRSLGWALGPGVAIDTCLDPRVAVERVRARDYAVVMADLRMPGMDGVEFLTAVARLRPLSVRLMLTASADFASAQLAINEAGVFRYLCKPWEDDALIDHVRAALDESRRVRELADHAQAWEDEVRTPTPEELERRRLEALEPGITKVHWGPNGEVVLTTPLA